VRRSPPSAQTLLPAGPDIAHGSTSIEHPERHGHRDLEIKVLLYFRLKARPAFSFKYKDAPFRDMHVLLSPKIRGCAFCNPIDHISHPFSLYLPDG
jgi:hypothetical protein